MACNRDQLDTVRTLILLEKEDEALEHIDKWLEDVNWIGVNVTPEDKKACLEQLCADNILDLSSFKRFIDELSKRSGMAVSALKDSLFAYYQKYQKAQDRNCYKTI